MHEKINKTLNIKSYFCKPYSAWEKGTVENINGIIRRFFPKGTDFGKISSEQIKYVENWINNRPMKVLNYLTPNEKFAQLSVAIASWIHLKSDVKICNKKIKRVQVFFYLYPISLIYILFFISLFIL